jgi:hypothetical protein
MKMSAMIRVPTNIPITFQFMAMAACLKVTAPRRDEKRRGGYGHDGPSFRKDNEKNVRYRKNRYRYKFWGHVVQRLLSGCKLL